MNNIQISFLKNYPTVLLVLSPEFSSLVKAFNRYANVFVSFIDPWTRLHLSHRLPGKIKSEAKIVPGFLLKLVGKVLNMPHRVRVYQVRPEDIDLIFVSDPITCRIDLKPFKNAVKVYWSHDCIYPSTYYTQIFSTHIQDYDIVFSAHKSCLDYFRGLGPKIYLLHFAYDPDVCRPMSVQEKYDLAFIGTITEKRRKILKEILARLPQLKLFMGNAWQHDMVQIYNESKIVLNISRAGELNWRVFEVLGCRRPLLTDKNQEVEEIFREGEHLVMYRDIETLIDKIQILIRDPILRSKIALNGHKEVTQRHTIYHRALEVLKIANVL